MGQEYETAFHLHEYSANYNSTNFYLIKIVIQLRPKGVDYVGDFVGQINSRLLESLEDALLPGYKSHNEWSQRPGFMIRLGIINSYEINSLQHVHPGLAKFERSIIHER